jgi:transposase
MRLHYTTVYRVFAKWADDGSLWQAFLALRMHVERTFAWEDKFKRLLLRFERIQQRRYGIKLMAYTLINLRVFCGT